MIYNIMVKHYVLILYVDPLVSDYQFLELIKTGNHTEATRNSVNWKKVWGYFY